MGAKVLNYNAILATPRLYTERLGCVLTIAERNVQSTAASPESSYRARPVVPLFQA